MLITFEWLRLYESLRTRATDGWILFKVLPRFPYVRTGSDDSIYDTSIAEVVDIPRRNSPSYVAYARTCIFEPSVYFEWLADRVTSFCRRLLQRLAFSESRHFNGIRIPPELWLMTLSPTTEAVRVMSCGKKPFV